MHYTGIGSRSTPPLIRKRMTAIAEEKRRLGFILRSGAAMGADEAFEEGAGEEKEIWLPWLGFRSHSSLLVPSPSAFRLVLKYHPNPQALMYSKTNWQLHARNCHQVLGADLKTPSSELVCWTPKGEFVGGTATALRIAHDWGIPIINLGKGK